MTVTKGRDGKKLTVAVEGRLDTLTSPDFEDALIPELNGIDTLVFDLRDEQDGEIRTLNVNKDVKNIFNITGLTGALGVE